MTIGTDLQRVINGEYRLVLNSKSARKIKKRGDRIQWSQELLGWIWQKSN